MAKFVFKLQGLLKQRKREEQERQRVLAERAAVVNAFEESLRRLNGTIETATADARQHLMGRLDMGFLAAHRRFMAAMQRQGTELVQKLVNAKVQLEGSRVQLAEAAKRRKAIEKLREKQFDRWRADEARKEAALTDEIGAQLGYRNMLEDATSDSHSADAVAEGWEAAT